MAGFEELDADDTKKAKRKMSKICATPEEVERYKFAPNASRHDPSAAIPCEGYGTMTDD